MGHAPKDIYEFIEDFVRICNEGLIESHRQGDTGIGKTLEDLLDIEENAYQAPDFADYELKAHRINGGSSMITLFTKSPDIKGANNRLREEYGYGPVGMKELHATLKVGTSSGEAQLGLINDRNAERVYISSANSEIPYAYYSYENIFDALHSKYATEKAVFVSAENYGPKSNESFRYVQADLVMGLDNNRFLDLLDDGTIKFDIRLGHYPDGRSHDHGSGFRLYPRDESKLFSKQVTLYNAITREKVSYRELKQLIDDFSESNGIY